MILNRDHERHAYRLRFPSLLERRNGRLNGHLRVEQLGRARIRRVAQRVLLARRFARIGRARPRAPTLRAHLVQHLLHLGQTQIVLDHGRQRYGEQLVRLDQPMKRRLVIVALHLGFGLLSPAPIQIQPPLLVARVQARYQRYLSAYLDELCARLEVQAKEIAARALERLRVVDDFN